MRTALVLLAAVLAVSLAVAVVVLVVVDSDDDDEPPPAEVSVDTIVSTPPLWYREPVEIRAPAVSLDDERFLLEGDGRAIIVQPQPGAVEGEVEPGERVTVRGVVYGLDRLQVSELRPLLRDDRRPQLADAPTGLGDPYVSANYVDAAE